MDRLLLVMHAISFDAAEETLREAIQRAGVPTRLTVGLVLENAMTEEETLRAKEIRGLSVTTGTDPLHAFPDIWQGENTVLITACDTHFSAGYDTKLITLLNEDAARTVLTGILPCPADPVDAVSAVAAESVRENVLQYRQGIPMRYADKAHRSAFLNPDFLFGPAAFFQLLAGTRLPPFLAAFSDRWELRTLHRPILHAETWHVPAPEQLATDAEAEAFQVLQGFGTHFGMMHEDSGYSISPGLREGIFTRDLQVHGTVPISVRIQEKMRKAALRLDSPDVLCVTSCPDNPERERPDALEMARFRRLRAIDSLKLLCFATPECMRTALFSHPNTLAWKSEHDLPVPANGTPEDARRYSVLNRFFLLARAQEKSIDHTHYAWIDFAYLRYPVYTGATLHWDAIATEKICIGLCDQHLDLSMMVVPGTQLLSLTRDVRARCEENVRLNGELPDPQAVLLSLAEQDPGRFDFLPIPTRGDLFSLTMIFPDEEWGTKRK